MRKMWTFQDICVIKHTFQEPFCFKFAPFYASTSVRLFQNSLRDALTQRTLSMGHTRAISNSTPMWFSQLSNWIFSKFTHQVPKLGDLLYSHMTQCWQVQNRTSTSHGMTSFISFLSERSDKYWNGFQRNFSAESYVRLDQLETIKREIAGVKGRCIVNKRKRKYW